MDTYPAPLMYVDREVQASPFQARSQLEVRREAERRASLRVWAWVMIAAVGFVGLSAVVWYLRHH